MYWIIVHLNSARRRWKLVPSPSLRGTYPVALSGVSAVSRNHIWAVGEIADSTILILHWNGKSWN